MCSHYIPCHSDEQKVHPAKVDSPGMQFSMWLCWTHSACSDCLSVQSCESHIFLCIWNNRECPSEIKGNGLICCTNVRMWHILDELCIIRPKFPTCRTKKWKLLLGHMNVVDRLQRISKNWYRNSKPGGWRKACWRLWAPWSTTGWSQPLFDHQCTKNLE